jgi:hypothetical protein
MAGNTIRRLMKQPTNSLMPLAVSSGIEVHHIDKIPVQVYSTEKTPAGCFKYCT